MKSAIDTKGYDTLLQPTDWRAAASVTGLCKYFKYHGIEYSTIFHSEDKPNNYIQGFDGIMYRRSDITEERYLEFAEHYFSRDMTHLNILKTLDNDTFDDDKIKSINDAVKSKTVLKKIFGKTKFDGNNKEEIKQKIFDNEYEITKSIFRYGKNLYADYCNTNLLFTESNPHCRLVGYTVDEGRKTKYLGFCFSKDTSDFCDIPEYDFIPFAFSNSDMYETFFINNNYSVDTLLKTNEWLSKELSSSDIKNPRDRLFTVLKSAEDFLEFDVEIITKSRDEELYKSLFVRSERLKLLRELPENSLNFTYELYSGYWFNLASEVYERCLNNVLLDDLIVQMLKLYFKDDVNKATVKYKTDKLIDINQSWKGNDIMEEIQTAKKLGYVVTQELVRISGKNKVYSYKQKIISALVAHDYDRVKEVLLSLSAYVKMEFSFIYAFLEDAEKNKDIAFAFASALDVKDNK
ncbi:MAG: type I CRISPR-associated protein Cas8a1/Csx8 [Clostridiales bacterium]|nr:type I CRISPR-associated protein Cas8a1/Csx8 [Clostridiales bacterium]